MRHISLDESFWRSATEALVSGECIEDVEPSLLDVSRLLRHLHDSANASSLGRLGLLTLGGTEEERALGLTLAALIARGGSRVLLADCDFTDQTWSRLLGAEEPDGIADHVLYGTSPRRLVRRTSWDELSLLPAGTLTLDAAEILRSDKLSACLNTAGSGYQLVCVGLAFDEALEWGQGATAGMDRAILVGPADEELAFELAIPRLVRRVELLATFGVPPLGRWRPALGAALPGLAGTAARRGADLSASVSGSSRILADVPGPEPAASTPASSDLRFLDPAAVASGSDAESAADVAFLASLPRGEASPATSSTPSAPPGTPVAPGAPPNTAAAPPTPPRAPVPSPLVHPRLRSAALQQQLELPPTGPSEAEFAADAYLRDLPGWKDAEPVADHEIDETEDESSGRSVWLTALAVLLCLGLGAGAFWFWRASQQVPEGQFTFVESRGDGVNEEPAVAVVEGAEDGASPSSAAPAASAGGRVTQPGGAPAATKSSAEDDAAAESLGVRAASPGPAQTAAGATEASGAAHPRGAATGRTAERAALEAAAGERAAIPAPAASEAARPVASYDPPKNGPLLGYSLHVGSYQTLEAAQRAAQALRAKGLNAFVTPVLLEEKGEWQRVFVEALPDAPVSQQSLARAQAAGMVREGTVRETPWALYLGTFETPTLAGELTARLAKSGVWGYAVGTGPVHVYAGAFESAGDAEILNRQLRDRGFESALVRRRGVEKR